MAGVSRDLNLQGALQQAIDQGNTLARQVGGVRAELSEAQRQADALGNKVGETAGQARVMGDGIMTPLQESQAARDALSISHISQQAQNAVNPVRPMGMTTENAIQAMLAREGITPLSREELSALERRHSIAPPPGRYHQPAPLDTPEDWAGQGQDFLERRAASLWAQQAQGGAYHQMQTSGDLGRVWGKFLKGGMADSQREAANAAASPAGRDYMGAREGLEELAQQIMQLQSAITGGGTAAVRAAQDLKKAEAALDELGQKGRTAAGQIGGTLGGRLHAEHEQYINDIRSGRIAPQPGGGNPEEVGGHGMTGAMLWNAVRDPQSAGLGMLDLAGAAAMDKLAFGGQGAWAKMGAMFRAPLGAGATAAGLAVGVPAAVGAGWAWNLSQADDRTEDARARVRDSVLGASMGMGWRGTFYNEHWDAWDWDKTAYGLDGQTHRIDVEALRGIMPAMGVSARGWTGDKRGSEHSMAVSADVVRRRSAAMGVSDTALAAFVGQGVQSGAISRDANQVSAFLEQIAGHTARAAEHGVTAGDALARIATLNARQVEALGKLSPGGQNFNANVLEWLDSTGRDDLKGPRAEKVMAGLGHVQRNNTLAMLVNQLSPDEERSWIQDYFGKDAGRVNAMAPAERLMRIKENPAMLAALQLRAISPGGVFAGAPGILQQSLGEMGLGLNTLDSLREELAKGAPLKDVVRGISKGTPRTGAEVSQANQIQGEMDVTTAQNMKNQHDLSKLTAETATRVHEFNQSLKNLQDSVNRAAASMQNGTGGSVREGSRPISMTGNVSTEDIAGMFRSKLLRPRG